MKISWKERKNHLCKLIKKVSDKYGGDDTEWLREYAKEMINRYRDKLEVPIDCFEKLSDTEVRCVVHMGGSISVPLEDCIVIE